MPLSPLCLPMPFSLHSLPKEKTAAHGATVELIFEVIICTIPAENRRFYSVDLAT